MCRLALLFLAGCVCALQGQEPPPDFGQVSKFLEAVQKADEGAVRSWLKRGMKADEAYPGGMALVEAAGLGDVRILKILLVDANPNAADECGRTAIHEAAAKGNRAAVQTLLAAHADPDPAGRPGAGCTPPPFDPKDTPLTAAARGGYGEIVGDLIAAGADAQRPNGEGETPMLLAAARGDAGTVKILLAGHADIHTPGHNGWTPLAAAASKGNGEIMALLLSRHANPTTADVRGVTPLMAAAGASPGEGSPDAVRLLLVAGADPAAMDLGVPAIYATNESTPRRTALQYAAEHGDIDSVQLLATALKDNVQVLTLSLGAAIGAAAEKGEPAKLRALIEVGNGLLPNDWLRDFRFGDCGQTPVFRAAEKGDAESIKMLMAAGADFTSPERVDGERGCRGDTPLLVAAYGLRLDAVEALLSAGAPTGRRNANGFNAIDELRDREANASEDEKARTRSLIERMKNLVVAQTSPWREDETVQFLSFTALKAMEMLEEPRAGDTPEKAAARARIVHAAGALGKRWPKAGGPWGIPLSNYGRRAPFRFDEYSSSITLELILLDAEQHIPSTKALEMAARDLETKLGDCEAGGEDGGPDPTVRFGFTTVKPPDTEVKGYQLVWKDIGEIGMELIAPGSTTWHRENPRSPGRVQLVPGTYYMYVQDDKGLHTNCETVDVGGNAHLSWEFHIVALQDGEGCKKP